MDNVIKYVKAIQGNVFGGYIRDKISQRSTFRDIDCRINKEQLFHLINILQVENQVLQNLTDENYRRMEVLSYTIIPHNNPDSSFKLDVLCCTERKWITYPCDFDVNMLVESNDSIYIRPHVYSSLYNIPDKISLVMNRCSQNKFALIVFPQDIFSDVMTILRRSKNLVDRGWLMDDYYLGSCSWVFAYWGQFIKNVHSHRVKNREYVLDNTLSFNTCSLCHEPFKERDVVLNTCCNHNFHWECNNSESINSTPQPSSTGIMHWFLLKKYFQCPICRQDAIKTNSFIFRTAVIS